MKVLLVADAAPAHARGGADQHVGELQRALRTRGVEVGLWSPPPEQRRTGLHGEGAGASSAADPKLPSGFSLPALALPGGRLWSTIHQPKVRQAFRTRLLEDQPSAVHLHTMQGVPPGIVADAAATGARLVWTHHDLYLLCPRSHLHDDTMQACDGPGSGARCGPCHRGGLAGALASFPFRFRHQRFRAAAGLCHRHLAPSRWVADALIAAGVPARDVEVLPPSTARPLRPALVPNASAPPRFVFAGGLSPAKGGQRLIEAMALLPQDWELDLYGPSADGSATPRPAPTVRYQGSYAPRDLDAVLDHRTALISCSVVRESFGRTVDEAIRRGVPVVVDQHGGPAEQVRQAGMGLICDTADPRAFAAALQEIRSFPRPTPGTPAPSLEAVVERLLTAYGTGG